MRHDAFKRILRGVRRRLLYVFVFFGVGASVTWYFIIPIFGFLLAPAEGRLSPDGKPIFTNPTDMLVLQVGVSIKGGLIAAFPMLLYQAYCFLRPLLGVKVKHFIWWFLPLGALCYIGGTAFAYFVVLPTGLQYLLQFGAGIATPVIRITEYMAMVTALVFWMGVVFELPLAMVLLTKLGIADYRRFQGVRRYVAPAAFTVGVIITPSIDPLNATLVAVPLILLYEVGILLSWLVRPKQVV
mgnify:FL=1